MEICLQGGPLPVYVMCLQEAREEKLLGYHLLVPTTTSKEAFIFSQRLMFMMPGNYDHNNSSNEYLPAAFFSVIWAQGAYTVEQE